jgi:hypothetical protein
MLYLLAPDDRQGHHTHTRPACPAAPNAFLTVEKR